MKYRFASRDITKTVVIPMEFIDEHMLKASGEYVKIYLYLLRHADMDIATEEIAEALHVTEGDVERAIAYWERSEAILKSSYIDVLEQENNMEDIQYSDSINNSLNIPEKKKVDVMKLKDDETFSSLLYIAQKYLHKIFKPTDIETFAYMYDVLELPEELIEYIVELCVQKGKRSVRYIEAIAIDFHAKGIKTISAAKAETLAYSTEVYGVMRAFGLGKRDPAPEELRLINKWFKEYGFSKEVIFEACERTMKQLQAPNFQYTDKILEKWYKEKVITITDIYELDKKYKKSGTKFQEKITASKKTYGNGQSSSTQSLQRTSNFLRINQREDDLESKALQKLQEKIRKEE